MQAARGFQCVSVSPVRHHRLRPTVLAAARSDSTSADQAKRRGVLLGLVGAGVVLAEPALAVDVQALQEAKERRKKALKAAAEDMKEEGVGKSAFGSSKYSMSEDKTPNIHTRQEEGLRTQVNA